MPLQATDRREQAVGAAIMIRVLEARTVSLAKAGVIDRETAASVWHICNEVSTALGGFVP